MSVPKIKQGPVSTRTRDDGSKDGPPAVSGEPGPSDSKVQDREDTATFATDEGYASTGRTNIGVFEADIVDPQIWNQPHQPVCEEAPSTSLSLAFREDKLMFTTEMQTEPRETLYRFEFTAPGVFKCALTGLVFVVTKKAVLLYRIVPWDENLLRSAGKMAAGPLFEFKCSDDAAVCELHLPHCETMQAPLLEDLLSVAHITDDGFSILKPLEITDTHVIVKVPNFSAFGLVKGLLKWLFGVSENLIGGQILLFLSPPNHRAQRRKLDVLLLPRNIPLIEVSKQQRPSVNIWAPSTCKLIRDQNYTLHCPQAIKIQPKRAEADLEFGPNYFPTFEIRLPINAEEVALTVKDQREFEVWQHDVDLTVPTRENPQRNDPEEDQVLAVDRLFSVRPEFIRRVSDPVLNQLLDILLEQNVIIDEEMQSVRRQQRADKARDVIDLVRAKGSRASSVLTAALREVDPWLARALTLS